MNPSPSSPFLPPWPLFGLATLLVAFMAVVALVWAGTTPAVAQDGYEPDQDVIDDVWGYARETDSGFDHVLRWMRALKTFGVVEDMTAAEAQDHADQYLAERWDPVVAELTEMENAPGDYEPDQDVIDDVWGYARETDSGFDHVLRWMRALKTFGVVEDMTAAEAQDYADQYLAERWDPVVEELEKKEAAATPNRAPVVDTQAENYRQFTGTNNAPRGVLVSKGFHGVFTDPDGDDLTYTVSVPGQQSHFVELLKVVRDEDVPRHRPREVGLLTRVWFRAEAEADWKALNPPLMHCPVVTATVTATDPEGLSVSLDGPFLIRWECYPEVVSATAGREAVALTFDWEVESDPGPSANQFTVNVVNGDGSVGTVAVSGVSVNGRVVRLELASELAEGQTVTVDYADDYRTPLRLAGGDDNTRAPGFTGQPVALDVSGPAFEAATVSGSTLTVTFNEELDAASAPAGSAFTVAARLGGGEARSIAGTGTASVEGAVVTVGLAQAVHGGHTVAVSYTPPGDGPVRDLMGNAAAAFSGEAVTNETPVIDPGAPRMALISATIKGATLTLAFNNDVHLDWNTRSVPDASRFAVTVNGETVSLAATRPVSVSTSTVVLTLDQAVSPGDTVTVSYTADWWDSIHSFGHRCCGYLYADNLTNHPVTNIMADARAPTLSAAAVEGAGQMVSVVDSKGAVVTLTFDEQLDPNAEPAPDAFSVTVNGVPVSFRPYSWSQGGRPVPALWDPVPVWINGNSVMLTLAGRVAADHEVAVRYEQPQSGARLQDLAGNPVAAFPFTKVENRTETSPPLIADAWSYAQETDSGYDHVLRWMRVLKTLGAIEDMTAAEAQGYADSGWERWESVAEELGKLENAPDDYQLDQQLIDDVWSYARETDNGFDHVLRWMRTLQTFGVLEDMTSAEAHDYANQHQAARWDPVAAELAAKEAAASEPEASVPVAPAQFAVSSTVGSLDLLASWEAVEGATSYRLRWRQAGGEFDPANAVSVTETEATITVSGYGQWEIRLQACNDAGCGPEAVSHFAIEPRSSAQGYRGQLAEVLRELSLRRPAPAGNDGVSAQSTHTTSIVYVIDDSGSMDGDFPEVWTALEGIRDETMANTKVALIAFGTDAGTAAPTDAEPDRRVPNFTLTDHSSAPWDDHIYTFGGKLGGTDYEAPLEMAKELLDKDTDSTVTTKKIIFLTDAQAPRPDAVVQAIIDANIVVDTIGFGDHYSDNFDVIKQIALDTTDGKDPGMSGMYRAVTKPSQGTTHDTPVTKTALSDILTGKVADNTATLFLVDHSFSVYRGNEAVLHPALDAAATKAGEDGGTDRQVGLAIFMGETTLFEDATETPEFQKYQVVNSVGSASLSMDDATFYPTGSTDIENALEEAYMTISGVTATNKRVVLITDGISAAEVKEATESDSALKSYKDDTATTLDVVAWGAHADRVQLKTWADAASGTFSVAKAGPPAPTGVMATPGEGTFTLSWNDPSDSTIDKYQYRAWWLLFWWSDWVDIPGSGADTTWHIFTGLTDGASYLVQLRAVSTDDIPGAPSVDRSATPMSHGIGLAATAGDGEIALSWNDPSDSSITKYQYAQRESDGGWSAWTDISSSDATTTSHTVTGLTNDTEYTIALRAVKGQDIYGPVSAVTATPSS